MNLFNLKKLERQLKDIAYGTKQVRSTNAVKELEDDQNMFGPVRRSSHSFVGAPSTEFLDHQLISNLERGQNIFEIHLTKVKINCIFLVTFY